VAGLNGACRPPSRRCARGVVSRGQTAGLGQDCSNTGSDGVHGQHSICEARGPTLVGSVASTKGEGRTAPGRLANQVAPVTGAAQGLGLGVANGPLADMADAAYIAGKTINVDGSFQPR